jgi:hypothetical protein
MKFAIMLFAAGCVAGCVSNPQGSNWALADFNKYERNYAAFPTERLQIGMSKVDAQAMFGQNMTRVAAEPTAETYAVDKWVSVAGPDYIGERLYLRFDHDRLANWRVAAGNAIQIVPRSW